MHLRTATHTLRHLLLFGLLLGLIGSSATAQEKDDPSAAPMVPPSSTQEAPTPPHAPGKTGAMVFVSPETGELVPVPAAGQMQRLLALGRSLATQRSAQVTDADGNVDREPVLFQTPVGVGARLDDRFLHALRLQIGPDGRTQWFCVADHDHAAPSGPMTDRSTTAGEATNAEAPES